MTSRTRLAVAFEHVYRVNGLAAGLDGDAVALFVDRAVAAGCSNLSAADRLRVSSVCRALDGLALAVELAAVRLPPLGLDGVERGLVDQAGLLTGGTRLHRRQQSMHETLDWSVALLDEAAALAGDEYAEISLERALDSPALHPRGSTSAARINAAVLGLE